MVHFRAKIYLQEESYIFVNNNQIRGVNDGSAADQAVNKRQLDKKLPLDGSSVMAGENGWEKYFKYQVIK